MEAAVIVRLLLGLAIPVALGHLVVAWAWRPTTRGIATAALHAGLAIGLGLGLSSAWFFLWGQLFGIGGAAVLAGDAVSLAFAVVLWRRRAACGTRTPEPGPGWPLVVAAVLVAIALASFVLGAIARPHGDGDAMGIWNMRARFLLEAWGDWSLVLFDLGLAHVDYPLLVPGAVTRLWVYAGESTVVAPAALAAGFTAACAATLFGALGLLRGRGAALLALAALLGTPFFVRQGAHQTADVPLAFFMLASIVPLILHRDRLGTGNAVLVGVAAACAGWTKNEGAVFGALLLILVALVAVAQRRGPALRGLLLGAVVPGLAVAYFKLRFGTGNDLVEAQSFAGFLARLGDGARYLQVGESFLARLTVLSSEGEDAGCSYAVLFGYALLAGRTPGQRLPRLAALVLLAMAGVYVAIFLVGTPYNLAWHLRTAVGRLLLQLWPATLMVAFAVLWAPGARRAVDA